jgi:RimJ/RimL family protein N-acetyltransferase
MARVSARRSSTPRSAARPAYLWALDDNPRAHAFYRRNGFELDGAEQFDELWQVTEVRFVR